MTDATPRTDGDAAQLTGEQAYLMWAAWYWSVPINNPWAPYPLMHSDGHEAARASWVAYCWQVTRNPDTGELTADGRLARAARERVEKIAAAAVEMRDAVRMYVGSPKSFFTKDEVRTLVFNAVRRCHDVIAEAEGD